MELGLTIPLRRHLGWGTPPYGAEPDRCCWDLHVITLRGQKSLLAVHCQSRYAVVLFGLTAPAWADLPGTFRAGLHSSLTAAGFPEEAVRTYFDRAGDWACTRTHGRRPVAFLNRAWEDVLALDYCLDETAREQPLLDHAINAKPSRCAGFPGLAPAAERMEICLNRRT